LLKKVLVNFFKVAAAGYLIYYLAYKFSWSEIPGILKKVDWVILLLAFIVYFLKYVFDATRWMIANKIAGIEIPFTELLKFKIIGPAFDFITPIPQGEDVYKFLVLQRYAQNISVSVGVPLFIRVSGLVSIAIFLPATLFYYRAYFKGDIDFTIVYAIVGVAILALLAYYLFIVKKLSERILSKALMLKDKALSGLSTLAGKWNYLLAQIALGVCSHLIYVLFVWLLVYGMGITFSYTNILLTLPLIYFAAILPSVAGGLGIKEGVVLWLLTFHGVDTPSAQAVALTHLLILVFFVLIGFVLYLTIKDHIITEK